MEGLKDLVKVLRTSNEKAALEKATKTVVELAKVVENKLKLVEEEGLIVGLVRVMGKEGERFREAREQAVRAVVKMSYQGGDEVRKGLFKHEGLIAGLVEIVGQKGSEYKVARERAVAALRNIAAGDDDKVKAGLFHFPGLMPRIEEILGDASLNVFTRTRTTTLTTTFLTWQHSSFRATFETYTLLLKLCNMKVPRAHPTSDSLSTLFRDSKDVASHILSFLESKRSDLDHAKDRARNHGEIIWK